MSIKNIYKNSYLYLFIYSIVFIIISFVSVNSASIAYDYTFHTGRIVGLAQSLANKDFLPNLNYSFLKGSGYAIPMFYGNWMLYLPAVVFIKTKIATLAFATFAWQSTFATSCTTYFVLNKMTEDKFRSFLAAIAVSCSVVYFGYGMTAVVPLIPLLLYALYKVLYRDELNPFLLAIVIALLVQTHVLSTIILAIFSAIIVLFNSRRLTWKKILSFLSSLSLSLLFSAGFIFQYIEQSISQNFFVNWKLRDFPFPQVLVMEPRTVGQIFGDYYWPIIFVFLFLGFIFIRKLDSFSRQLLVATIIMFVLPTRLLPWNILRETFLSVFQRTERLIYLLPVFVIIAIVRTAPKKLVIVVICLQVLTYIYSFPLRYTFDFVPYSERGFQDDVHKIMDTANRDAFSAYRNPFDGYTYDPSGDEYLTIDVNHEEVRNGAITQFEYNSQNVKISNIRNGYNRLDFDVNLLNISDEQPIVLPRIWYKGYTASYSDGASGSQPELAYTDKKTEDLAHDRALKKPNLKQKVLYNGRAVIQVSKSGHVSISYKKTVTQWIGYLIEISSFIGLSIYIFVTHLKKRLLS